MPIDLDKMCKTIISLKVPSFLQHMKRHTWSMASSRKDDNTTSTFQALDANGELTAAFSPISKLPTELMDMVLSYLPVSSAIALRRCNKKLYINGAPEPLNRLHSRLRSGDDQDDHLSLLCLLERDSSERPVCNLCTTMHEKKFFDSAEILKPPAERRCRTVQLCPHSSLTFSQYQKIVSNYTRDSPGLQNPLDCTFTTSTTNSSCHLCKPMMAWDEEHCEMKWSYNQFWKRGLYLHTKWIIALGRLDSLTFARSPNIGEWHLCPHITMEDCCFYFCRVREWARPGARGYHPNWHKPRNGGGWKMRCKRCDTEIYTAPDCYGLHGQLIEVKRRFGQGKGIDDAMWTQQTMTHNYCAMQ